MIGGGQIANFGEKNPQVHLIIIRESPKNIPPILRNLDNSPPGSFYSTPPPPLQLGTKRVVNKCQKQPP